MTHDNTSLDGAVLLESATMHGLRFEELNDVSVAQMIRSTKLRALKAELLKSRERLSVIGRRCGFANANYLKRIFLADTGLTMSEWRSQNKARRGQAP